MLRLGIVFVIFTICRFIFFWIYKDHFAIEGTFEVIRIFIHGLRFDLAAIIYVNSIFILLSLLPFHFRNQSWYQKLMLFFFMIGNIYAYLLEISDFAYFKFAFRRSISSDIQLLQNTAGHLTGQYIRDFWWVGALFFVFLFASWKFSKKFEPKENVTTTFLPQLGIFLISVVMFGIGARGGFQLRPIMSITAAEHVQDMRQIPLMTNTTLNMIFSFQRRLLKERTYFTKAELDQLYTLHRHPQPDSTFQNKNVVLIVMESMGKEYIGHFNPKRKGHTPFLDSLLDQSFYCPNSFANGLRSTQGIAALAAGIPALMEDPLMFSAYQSNRINGIASLLGKKGYHSAFFHGANQGSMEFERFSKICGFDEFHDRRHYNNDDDYDGNWGIWDIPFFQYTAQKMDQFEKPFFSMLFSLTAHHPYAVEADYAEKFPELDPVWRSVQYADEALRQFFDTAKKMDWYEETIFIITADHVGVSFDRDFKTKVGKYMIPIALFSPTNRLSGPTDCLMQQIDILPTLMEYLNYDLPYSTFGNNVLDTTLNNSAIMLNNSMYQILDNQYLVLFDDEKVIGFYNYQKDPKLKNKLKDSEELLSLKQRLKAIIQRHDQAMIHNQLILD